MNAADLRARYGTEEPPPDRITLRAGPLEAILEEGALRTVTVCGHEVLRAVAFLMRGPTWDTAATAVADLAVDQREGGFDVTFAAVARMGDAALPWRARIEGRPDRLLFHAEAWPDADVLTGRTGFVVLQPLGHIAGHRVEVTHVDGRTTHGRFPDLIDPEACFTDMAAMAYEAAAGLRVAVRMDGDAWEMEDHRNWLDASLKTYVRPLRLPSPYVLTAGSVHVQSVILDVLTVPRTRAHRAPSKMGIVLGSAGAGRMPAIGLRLGDDATLEDAVAARPLGAQHLIARFDLAAPDLAARTIRVAGLAHAMGAEAALEVVLPCEADPEDELVRLARAVEEAALRPASILLSLGRAASRVRPGPPPPPDALLGRLHLLARRIFPLARLGGGTVGAFAELNRNRPPFGLVDFVSWSAASLVHDATDATMMENLDAVSAQARSLRAMAGAVPWRLGAVGLALDPGPFFETVPNSDARRMPLASSDPRSAGLFGAAWMVGALAALASAGAEAAAPATLGGGAPLLDHDGAPLPAWHVVRAAAGAAGRPVLSCLTGESGRLAGLAWDAGGRAEAWIANLTDTPIGLRLPERAEERPAHALRGGEDAATLGPYGIVAVGLST